MVKKKYPECSGIDKPIPKGFVPVTLYHVSVNVDKVCKEGLKDPHTLFQESKKSKYKIKLGLGGANDNKISTSYDKDRVEGYFNDLVVVAKIQNGELTPKNICSYLDKHDKTKTMTKSPCEIWKSLDNIKGYEYVGINEGYLSKLEQGKIHTHNKGTIELINEISNVDADKWGLGTDPDPEKRYAKWRELSSEQKKAFNNHFLFEKGSPEEIKNELFQYWNFGYLHERFTHKGRVNPAIWNKTLVQTDPTKIGIIKIRGFLPRPLHEYLNYMRDHEYEYQYLDGYTPEKGFPDEKKYEGKFKILTGESEIRLNPEWYNGLEILKKGK